MYLDQMRKKMTYDFRQLCFKPRGVRNKKAASDDAFRGRNNYMLPSKQKLKRPTRVKNESKQSIKFGSRTTERGTKTWFSYFNLLICLSQYCNKSHVHHSKMWEIRWTSFICPKVKFFGFWKYFFIFDTTNMGPTGVDLNVNFGDNLFSVFSHHFSSTHVFLKFFPSDFFEQRFSEIFYNGFPNNKTKIQVFEVRSLLLKFFEFSGSSTRWAWKKIWYTKMGWVVVKMGKIKKGKF